VKDKIKEISESTVIPLTLVIAIMGGTVWLSSVYNEAKEARVLAGECSEDFKKIDERLSHIEGKLGIENHSK
jgi:hypothetical protein